MANSAAAELGGTCIGIVVAVVVFFVTRELWCWYLKINVMVARADDVLHELRAIRAALEKSPAQPPSDDGWPPLR